MKNDNQDELIVDRFYDLITEAEQPVKHAAHFVLGQDQTSRWEWQLAGTYIIINECNTVAMACDGLRLARFTAPTALGGQDDQMRGFLPHHYKRSCENDTYYDLFTEILTTFCVVKDATMYNRKNLICLCMSDQLDGITTTILGLTMNVKHVLDFCYAAQKDFITCQVVTNQSQIDTKRLKLIAGQLEELLVPIIS